MKPQFAIILHPFHTSETRVFVVTAVKARQIPRESLSIVDWLHHRSKGSPLVLRELSDQDALGVGLQHKPLAKLSYTPGISDRFPSKLTAMKEAPEPSRSAMREKLSLEDSISLLIFGPANRFSGIRSPATLLVVTGKRWLLASDAEDGM